MKSVATAGVALVSKYPYADGLAFHETPDKAVSRIPISSLPRACPPRPGRELPDHRGDHDPAHTGHARTRPVGLEGRRCGRAGRARRGLCALTLEQAQPKRVTLYAARTAVVLVEQSELGASPFPYWVPLDRPYTLVVDEQADPATVAPFRTDGAVLLAPVTSAPARPAVAQAGQSGAVAG